MNWLSKEMISEIRKVFEPRYKRKLTDEEVEGIADNLTGVIEEIVKHKWKEKYDSGRSTEDTRKKSR